jgi:glucose/arabinose dehydrogenase
VLALAARAAYGDCAAPAATAPIPAIALRPIVAGFSRPLHFAQAPDGRTFVVEQEGRILQVVRKAIVSPAFLDIRDRVDFEPGSEKGLLGVAFHPQFATNGRYFVDYTGRENDRLKTFVSELVGTSERVVFKVRQPFDNHNGGGLAFGPDGLLYVGMGDGGGGNDPFGNAQSLGTRLGKILRIDVDHASAGRAFAIPPDNPFVGVAGAKAPIWAYGFRNPWRISFDRATGELFAGDVGQSSREEIDLVVRGGNYGWNVVEGSICTPGVSPSDCDQSGFVPPLAEYDHDDGCSVTGGFVYRGTKIPALCGVYVYGDFCSGLVRGIRQSGGRRTAGPVTILDSGLTISSFGETRKGELRVVDYGGALYKVVAAD